MHKLIEANTKYGYMSYYANDIYFVHHLSNGNIFEQSDIEEHLTEIILRAKVAVDIGAHAGSHTLIYKKINPELTIHSFEPQKEMFKLLKHNVEKNQLKDVHLYNFGVSNKSMLLTMRTESKDAVGSLEAHYGKDDPSNFGGLAFGEGGEPVKAIPLDDLHLIACDFIKMDIEGAEPLAIMGAKNTILTYRPTIMFEDNGKRLDQSTIEKFGFTSLPTAHELLTEYGYKKITQLGGSDNYLAEY